MYERYPFRRLPTAVLLLWPVMSFTGCGGSSSLRDYVVETLPSGAIRTTYHSLPLRRLDLDTLAVWNLWDEDRAGYAFSSVRAAVGVDDGFLLLDAGSRQVVMVDREGRARYAFGARGDGPGEFQFPRILFRDDANIWVFDIMTLRFSIFSSLGEFRRDIRLKERWSLAARRMALTPGPKLLAATSTREGNRSLLAAPLDFSALDTLATMKTYPTESITFSAPDGRTVDIDEIPEFGAEFHWDYDAVAGRLMVVQCGQYRFEERHLSGRVIRELVAPTPDLRVTDRERAWFFENVRFGFGYQPDGSYRISPELRRKWPFAERRQAIAGIRVDPIGRIWVLANTVEVGVSRLDLFDREDRYLGHLGDLPLPMAFTPGGDALFRLYEGIEDDQGKFILVTIR